ncbi:MAG: BACON domain-containing protein [Armatimonadota bacterium]
MPMTPFIAPYATGPFTGYTNAVTTYENDGYTVASGNYAFAGNPTSEYQDAVVIRFIDSDIPDHVTGSVTLSTGLTSITKNFTEFPFTSEVLDAPIYISTNQFTLEVGAVPGAGTFPGGTSYPIGINIEVDYFREPLVELIAEASYTAAAQSSTVLPHIIHEEDSWEVFCDEEWITITGGVLSGTGSADAADITFDIGENTGEWRRGFIRVRTWDVWGEEVIFRKNIDQDGPGCPWTAKSNVAWITITGGSEGEGDGTVTYSVSSNPGAERIGTITLTGEAGQELIHTVMQGAAVVPPPPAPAPRTVGIFGLVNVPTPSQSLRQTGALDLSQAALIALIEAVNGGTITPTLGIVVDNDGNPLTDLEGNYYYSELEP